MQRLPERKFRYLSFLIGCGVNALGTPLRTWWLRHYLDGQGPSTQELVLQGILPGTKTPPPEALRELRQITFDFYGLYLQHVPDPDLLSTLAIMHQELYKMARGEATFIPSLQTMFGEQILADQGIFDPSRD